MPTLKVTPDPARAAVQIETSFADAASVVGMVTVTRTDEHGTVTTVRGLDRYPSPMGVTVGIDQEAPFGQRLTYRATGLADDGTVVATSATATSWVAVTPERAWLRVLARPALSASFAVRDWPDWDEDKPEGVFYPRKAKYPLVVSGKRRAGVGTLILKVTTADELAALRALIDEPGPYLLQGDPAAGEDDVYVTMRKSTRQRLVRYAAEPHRFVPLPVTIVDRPALPRLVVLPGRSFADLAARYPNAGAYPSPMIAALR